ncbi:ABC transporter ATP-binding protein [Mumia sp. ZJ1417]|uniref:ABC transporter ATP-binding protein n=1 Tax=Mumia sp. ZJ1417 TaxID=2708082 RepID=UPI001420FAA3|nr:ABC transporter ATP-binding protein [Mumia sp. ZJ1417]QMW67510.1 ABC transporter ATP-binding protein [Mumia sp. ZJ1417]
MTAALEIEDLWVEAGPADDPLVLVRGVDLAVEPGTVVGLVGESGSGKTVTCMSALGLAGRGVRITRGSVRAQGTELVGADEATMRRVRGGVVGTVFQDPLSSLNPLQRIGDQIAEALVLHRGGRRRAHRERVVSLLAHVGVPAPEQRARAYPHELSGGLRQRVAIAMALANDPAVLVADEPTTALDVTVQAQVLDVIRAATRDEGRATLLVTHDLGVVAEAADRVAVMYAGQIVEEGPVASVFAAPQHPYTRGLLASRPVVAPGRRRLSAMPGRPPLPGAWPLGCAFEARCPSADDACGEEPPVHRGNDGWARCWRLPSDGAPDGSAETQESAV